MNKLQNIILGLMIISGVLSAFVNAYLIQIQLTLYVFISALVIFVLNGPNLKITPRAFYFLGFAFILFLYMIITLTFSPSVEYKYVKTGNFLVNVFFFLSAIFVRRINLDIIIKIARVFSISLALFYSISRYTYWLPSNASFRGGIGGFGEFSVAYLGIGTLLALVIVYDIYHKRWIWFGFQLLLLISLGSRGSVIFVLLIWFLELLRRKSIKINVKKLLYLLPLIPVLIGFLIYYNEFLYSLIEGGIQRLASLINFKKDTSSLGRLDHYSFVFDNAFSSFFDFTFGHGIGSYGINHSHVDGRSYPHNLFLEVFYELGIIGIVILFFLFFVLFYKNRSNDRCIKLILIYLFIESMKSNNLTDLWILFFFAGVYVLPKKILNERDRNYRLQSR